MLKINWDTQINLIDALVLKKLESSFESFLVENLKIKKNITLHVTLCDDELMIDLNTKFRRIEKVTDVLSFPIFENIRSNPQEIELFEEVELGDIYICDSVCQKQASEFSLNYYEEFVHLAIHGFLHLLGFDHEISEVEDELMQLNEKKLAEAYKSQ